MKSPVMFDTKSGALATRYRFFRRIIRLAGPYWTTEERWKALGLTIALVLLTVAQVVLAIWTNYWNGALFDALGDRSLERFLAQIGIFAIIFILTIAVTGAHLQVKRQLQIGWRAWLTKRVIDRWMTEKRHYQLIFTPGEHDNPDGRISEDIHNVTELAVSLTHTLVYSLLILGSFIDILLSVAGGTDLRLDGSSIHVPGYMVVLAFGYAGVGTLLGLALGRSLVRSTNELQTMEANFRFGLARAREEAEAIALVGGEPMERRRSFALFADIREWWNRQSLAFTWIIFFTSGYGALLPVFPILVCAPQYIAGTMSLGILMQTAQAFQKLTSALSWPIDNVTDMAKWKASADRVLSLHEDLEKLDTPSELSAGRRIEVGTAPSSMLAVVDLHIAQPDGLLVLDGFNLEVREGEHVLIDGDARAAVDFFKVTAGLWPWGSGRVLLPKDRAIFFMPQSPFIFPGPLRAVLSYPEDPSLFDDNAMREALDHAGIGYLTARLSDTDAWDQVLTMRGRQRLGFARLFLHRPRWIFMQEATDAFDPLGEEKMLETMKREFPHATILAIGFHSVLERFHERKICLDRPASGRYLFGGPATDETRDDN
jgi:putative ATP-binding cassette transporter